MKCFACNLTFELNTKIVLTEESVVLHNTCAIEVPVNIKFKGLYVEILNSDTDSCD
ncbi:hypothetical protein [Metabacillus endolithicus]|uniref:Uncharacterized protein n=1 Tax=Metabacillus endolithicus TaxID=1535204 RepID=A0ABW5C1S0_9BACI|nr:hypothetical protein [Metabacillus endolithicus]UPG66024.1 hypothetical protein MVE64_26625 [Metabacillus endolithicus]